MEAFDGGINKPASSENDQGNHIVVATCKLIMERQSPSNSGEKNSLYYEVDPREWSIQGVD